MAITNIAVYGSYRYWQLLMVPEVATLVTIIPTQVLMCTCNNVNVNKYRCRKVMLRRNRCANELNLGYC